MAAPLTQADFAEMSVGVLKGVGPAKEKALAKVGIESVLDLLTHYPRRWIDRTREARIADLVVGEEAMVLGVVESSSMRRINKGRTMTTVVVGDGSGRLRCTFFNQPWREKQLSSGRDVVVFGKLEDFRGQRQMSNPVVDLVGNKTGKIVPIYPQSEKAGLNTWDLAEWIGEILRRASDRTIGDPVPRPIRARYDLVDRHRAVRLIHQPESMADTQAARRRLVFDELLRVQLALVLRKRHLERTTTGVRHVVETTGWPSLVDRFHDRLDFPLTGAQRRSIDEIVADLLAPAPMHRLLQGDVGAGKTVVAVSALLVGVQGGHQTALMAPTEVLAEQHHLGISALLEGFMVPDDETLMGERELRVALLTNRTGAADRRKLLADLAGGRIDLVIGTHSLIQDSIEFESLGVVVIDEQHRFGVEQRAALREKNAGDGVPDVLVMTATPIPRTAAMTVYGDLDVSVLDELPPGRTPIETERVQDPDEELRLWDRVRSEIADGRQIYVVCPLIDESETLEVRSATETFDELRATELEGLDVGLLHGRISAGDKEQVMSRFRDGTTDVLVATTVIEVGVDVPNATVMVILDADRFGIAQLHQLRGRVGRGSHRSYCFLVGEAATNDGEARLDAMVRSTDGFELAEIDLDLRGEGTLMGERQKGSNDLKLASLRRDRDWVERAREAAFELVDADPTLGATPELADEMRRFLGEADTEFLMKS